MRAYFILSIVILLFVEVGSQHYQSTLLDYDRNPNASHLISINKTDYLIKSINSVDDSTSTSILIIDSNFNIIRVVDFKHFLFARNCPIEDSGKYYFFADATLQNDLYQFGSITNEFEIDSLIDYNFSIDKRGGITAFDYQNNRLVGAIGNETECQQVCGHINLINIEENNKWNIDLDQSEKYFFSFEIDFLDNGQIITGGNRYGTFSGNAAVYNINSNGDINWKFISSEDQSRGNVPVWVEELSDGNIVFADKIEDPHSLSEPTKLVWLSPEGDSLMHWVDQGSYDIRVEIDGSQKGLLGDYFFIYGHTTGDGPDNKSYGYIYKFSNQGEPVWQRKYQHLGYENDFHQIRDLIELDNGDIVTLGAADIKNIWMMRLNEHGCFGTEDCGSEVIYTTTDDLGLLGTTILYPNPTKDMVYLSEKLVGVISKAVVYNLEGVTIMTKNMSESSSIDIASIPKGLYLVSLISKDGQTFTQKVEKF